MSEVTAPIMTDATGQSIDSRLNSLLGKMDNLAAAFQPNASGIVYSNTTSGLTGDDVQEAIDEMAADVSEIKQSLSHKLIAQEIPYSNFTFDSTNNCFVWSNPTFTGISPLFFVAYATNGGAILSVTDRRSSSSSRISVEGWIPNIASKITSAFEFKCYVVGVEA